MILPLPWGHRNCAWIAPIFFVPDAVGSYQRIQNDWQRGPLVWRIDARHASFLGGFFLVRGLEAVGGGGSQSACSTGVTSIDIQPVRRLKDHPRAIVSVSMFVVNAVILLIATLGEEIGWRGVALPALQ